MSTIKSTIFLDRMKFYYSAKFIPHALRFLFCLDHNGSGDYGSFGKSLGRPWIPGQNTTRQRLINELVSKICFQNCDLQ